ncbi:glutathione S-transferase C-terminal-like protein [Amylocystis lapponica]|nr:glutathione S-transferase C-terminal-like protein [Amylocystis lapponica]
MSHGKHFTLYSHDTGPNGWKVAMVLEELGLTYDTKYLNFSKGEQKAPEHTQLNPNGRVPTLVDHKNNDFVVWESNAIMTYLVEKYDLEHKISVVGFEDKIVQLQWLFFQSSGQGPYFGQAAWFIRFHPEKIPSAIERYQKEIIRVFGVLESVLAQREWLVGGTCTVADISFIPWNVGTFKRGFADYNGFNFEKDFPAVHKWHTALLKRESISKVLAIMDSMDA